MKNLMSRDKYLQKMDEGFFKDKVVPVVKKGWEAVKSAFKIGMLKVRNFIAIFDSNGKVLPVVSLQTVIDRFSNNDAIKVYAPKSISDTVVEAGGKGCDSKAPLKDDDEFYDDESWDDEEAYKNSNEYKNFLAIPDIVKEHYNCSDEEANRIVENMVGESWKGIVGRRIKYSEGEDFAGISDINYEQFKKILSDMVEERVRLGDKKVVDSEGNEWEADRNILVFGAPGIGKSTIPNAVISEYNQNVAKGDPSKMISLISINCALLEQGGLVMPTMPQPEDIERAIKKFSKAFPEASEYLEGLDEEDAEKMANTLGGMVLKVKDAPKSWLPSYQITGDDNVNLILDSYANGGVYKNADGTRTQTGNGGIILFDEFLRADPDVFSQLMNFFLDRQLYDWQLGSKWTIIGCSNRPCDDGKVEKKWKSFKESPAMIDRYESMFQLIPDPEQWKKWAREKKVDELFLEFIFDKESKDGREYPRWHSMVKNPDKESNIDLQIGPRRWESVFKKFKKYEVTHGYKDLSEMSLDEIKFNLSGLFDKVFIAEIIDWLQKHLDAKNIDLDLILTDPKSVKLPAKFINDPSASLALINVLYTKFSERFKDNPEDCSDEQLANLYKWLGINYKDDYVTVYGFADKLAHNIFADSTKNRVNKKIKAMQTIISAFPPHDIKDDIEYAEHNEDEECRWPEGSFEILKDIMREDFPWRIDGDNIKYYDEFDMDAVKDYSAKIHEVQLDNEK